MAANEKLGFKNIPCQHGIISKFALWLEWVLIHFSYTLSREYRVVINRYSWLLFTSEDRLYASWHVTSQINCGDVTMLIQKRPSSATIAKWAIDDLFLAELCVQNIKQHVRNEIIHWLPWIMIFGSLVMRFAKDLHSWLRHSWKSLANRLTRDPKIVIHGNSCIILVV